MEDPWSDNDDDILLSEAADKFEHSFRHETQTDDDVIFPENLERREENLHLHPVSHTHSVHFTESDGRDDDDDDDLILSRSLDDAEGHLQHINPQSDRFPESDDDGDLVLSQNVTETEEQQKATSFNKEVRDKNQNHTQSEQRKNGHDLSQSDTMLSPQSNQKQSEDSVPHGQMGELAEGSSRDIHHIESADEGNMRSVLTAGSSSEAVAGPSDEGCDHKEVDKELQKKKKSLEDVKNTFDSELQCSICNELFIQATTLNCAHAFCALCISQWLRTSRACPMCRTTVTSQTKSIVLDNFINKMCEHLGEGMKEERQQLLEAREREQAQFNANIPRHDVHSRSPVPVNIGPFLIPSSPDSSPIPHFWTPSPYPNRSPPLSPSISSSSYSDTSFIDDRSLSDSTQSSDSLYSTDSSATDFSDHSPRSRQRRREMRHRERRSRRQRRRNRHTDSDSSMSYGRRIDWRRRMRRRRRMNREDRDKGRDRSRRRGRGENSSEDTSSDSSNDEGRVSHDDGRHRRRWRVERSRHRNRRDRDSSSEDSLSFSDMDSDERGSRERVRHRRRDWRIESDSGDSVRSRGRRGRRGERVQRRSRQRDGDGSASVERQNRRRNRQRIVSSDDENAHTGGSRGENQEQDNNVQRGQRTSEQTANNGQSRNSGRTECRWGGQFSRTNDGSIICRSSRASNNRSGNSSGASTSRGTGLFSSQSSSRPYYGGYGKCFKCGRSGHWANGCPNR